MTPYAHSNGPDDSAWQSLADHSEGVARLAESFASLFCSGAHAALLAHCHDLGKARKAFQSYLLRCNGVEDADPDYGDRTHAMAWAIWLWRHAGNLGKALTYCVAGHHAGLPDWSVGVNPNGALAISLKEDAPVLEEQPVREWIASHEADWLRERLTPPFLFSRDDSSLSFWIRITYSCLVDADFLDTEAFMYPAQSAIRWGAKSIIMAHNHPSGDATPGQDDIRLTEQLVEASRIIGIPIRDHIVMASTAEAFDGRGFVSMSRERIVQF